MRNLAVKNILNLGGWTTARGCGYERTHIFGEREVRLVGDRQYMSDLRDDHGSGYAFLSLQPDTFGDDGLEAAAIVEAVGLRIPENRIDVEQIVLK